MLRQQIQLLRNFVGEINNMEGLKSTEPIWRGISNVFTDLSGMFGGGTGRHYQVGILENRAEQGSRRSYMTKQTFSVRIVRNASTTAEHQYN